MATPKQSARRLLELRRDAVIAQLREREPDLLVELLSVQAALGGMQAFIANETDVTNYSRFGPPIDAIEAYLDRVDKFSDRAELLKTIVAGGYAGERNTNPRQNLIDNIRYHLKPDKKGANPRLIQVEGKIGRFGWQRDRLK